jgi:hypothetical protein
MNLNFDSYFATYKSNDCFDARFPLSTPIIEAKKLTLKSLELPVNFNNIRNSGTLNQFSISTNLGNTYNVSIPSYNYSTIDTLVTALNNAFVGVVPNTTFTFVTGNYITLSATSTTITSFVINKTSLSNAVLGFKSTGNLMSITATSPYLLNVDNYIIMYINNIQALHTENTGNFLQSFKIPLNAVNGVVYYQAENSNFSQSVYLAPSHIQYLDITIYDRFGQKIQCNNSDYSFSLSVE